MAVVTTRNSSEAEVSSCVQNIIFAFTDGLNVFKRLKERRKRKKNKHKSSASGEVREVIPEAELQLSNSLKRGPLELREKYERYYGEDGEVFAKGDAIAHASLAETLIKLNTGLVRIIATFLNCDAKTSSLHLDYKSLISLSDASRREAVESLNQLHNRLSQSQLRLHRMAPAKSGQAEKKRRAVSRQRMSGPIVARTSVKNSSQKKLVMMRPTNPRRSSAKSSSSSASSMKSHQPTPVMSSPSTSPLSSAPVSPLPQYSAKDPFPPIVKTPIPKMKSGGKRRASSGNARRPTMTTAHAKLNEVSPFPSTLPQTSPTAHMTNGSHQREKHTTPSPQLPISAAAVARRRLDKVTPSSYTFASDSTKLGEIPQRNWTTPWDYEEAERLNALAAEIGYPHPTTAAQGVRQRKRGLFGFMRRGSGGAA